jgi:multiple sugar transport system ATP-binding protein
MTAVSLQNVSRHYRDAMAVQSLNLEIADREFVVLLGPSGCGKTTTLNMIAGMDAPSAGRILFDGRPVNDVPPERRNVAMVFQSIALYPHKTVFENIAFPLRMAKTPAAEIDTRVRAAAQLMRIGDLLNRRPHELSGGQRQRVALGRAAVRNPLVFLFDEPLSALDAQLRTEMRVEIKKLHERLHSTFIYVTHDQVEALTMADRIAVMDGGRLKQYGTPEEVYRRPADVTVASFLGSPSMNLVSGQVRRSAEAVQFESKDFAVPLEGALAQACDGHRGALILGVRPESLSLDAAGLPFTGKGRVYAVEPLGSDQFVDIVYGDVDLEAPAPLRLRTRPDLRFKVGDPITAYAQPQDLYLFDAGGQRIFPGNGGR